MSSTNPNPQWPQYVISGLLACQLWMLVYIILLFIGRCIEKRKGDQWRAEWESSSVGRRPDSAEEDASAETARSPRAMPAS
jgi:hypothetical protein